MGAVDLVLDEEGAVGAHVLERGQVSTRGGLGQPGHAVLEDPAVELLDAQLLPGAIGRFEVLANSQRAVGIDAPRELDPHLVLFPHLPQPRRLVSLPREVEGPALALEGHAQHGLAEADPARGMRLLAHEVVALGGMPHGQHVVGEPRRLAPDGSEAGVPLHLGLVREHLDPRHAVGIGPHRVVDAGEVHGELAPPLPQEMGKEEAHLEEGERILAGKEELAPHLGGRRHHGRRGYRLVPRAGRGAAGHRHRAHQHHHQLEARATSQPNRLPAAALRQTWLESAPPARPISRATSSMRAAGTPVSFSAKAGVYSA